MSGRTGSAYRLLSPALQRHIAQDLGFQALTPIQEAAIPPVLAGRDVLLLAPTAGGKTEAAVWPLLDRLQPDAPGVQVLYLSPLVALLNNLEARVRASAAAVGRSAAIWHGDVGAPAKRRVEQQPTSLLMITPESLESILIRQRSLDVLVGALQAVVVDEIHHFAAGDRGVQVQGLLARVEKLAGRRLHRAGLSATVGNPESVLAWLTGGGGELVRPAAAGARRRHWQIDVVEPAATAAVLLPVLLRPIAGPGRVRRPRTLVFCTSRARTEELAGVLAEGAPQPQDLDLHVHHGSVSRRFREEAEQALKLEGVEARSILSTSTLELGIDVGNLDRVVQLGRPPGVASFLQRVGRVGRREGQEQSFLGLIELDPEDPRPLDAIAFLATASILNLAARGEVESVQAPPKPFHVLAQQILAHSLERNGIEHGPTLDLLLACPAFATIERGEAEAVVAHMLARQYLRWVGTRLLPGERAERELLASNFRPLLAVFDPPYEFVVVQRSKDVGVIGASFARRLEEGAVFRLAGRAWQVQAVDLDRARVAVVPARAGKPPQWVTMGPPTSRAVAEEMVRLLRRESEVIPPLHLPSAAVDLLEFLRVAPPIPTPPPGRLRVRKTGARTAVIEAAAGDEAMGLLARWLSARGLPSRNVTFVSIELSGPAQELALRLIETLQALPGLSPDGFFREVAASVPDRVEHKFDGCVPSELLRLRAVWSPDAFASLQELCANLGADATAS